jgi:hypothetical protein
MTCCTAFVHECSPSRPSSALCGPPAGRWGSIPGRITAGSGSWTATARRSWRKPLAEAIHARYRALVFVGAYGGLRIGSWPGSAQAGSICWLGRSPWPRSSRVKGKLIAGPPKTRAGRRTVGLPPFVTRELEEHLAAAQRPRSHIVTAPGGGPLRGPRAFGRALGCRLPRQPACASTTFATPPWRCGSPPARRPRRSPCARGTPRSASPWTAMATRRSPGRSRRAGAIQ